MFNYENGKKLVTIGFALNLALVVSNFVLRFFGNLVLGGIGGFLAGILSIVNIVSILSICVAAVGFGIMWLIKREMLDFAAAAILAFNVFYNLFYRFIFINAFEYFGYEAYVFLYLIFGALLATIYLVLAIRVKDANRMLFLLLCCAFLFNIVMLLYSAFASGILPYFLVFLISGAGNIVCAGLCFLAARQD